MIVAVYVHAGLVWNQDGSVRLATSKEVLQKRFPNARPGEVHFAHAELDKENILNLGDPVKASDGWVIETLPRVAELEGVLVIQTPARVPDREYCPCGARAHKGMCAQALEADRRAGRSVQ